MDTLATRLEKAIKLKETLSSEVQKTKGKLEQARASLEALEEECRSKNLDPNSLDATLKTLEAKYETLVGELEEKLKGLE
jgi:chromosome segregation ATPase